MKILVDENILLGEEVFGTIGEVELFAGRHLTAEDLRDADALIVRSTTRVDAELLQGTAVRFLGTATIGTDHVDLDYLHQQGIAFADAAGSSADAVAEYVFAAISRLVVEAGLRYGDLSLGVIGVGAIGSRVARYGRLLGMRVLLNDPPLAKATGRADFLSLDDVLAEADIVTLHVPLTTEGEHATRHLIDAEKLSLLHAESILINTSRGAVVDNRALCHWLQENPHARAVLDVWENEPDIDAGLVERVRLATPHIAGYSYEGKLNGTLMIFRALCRAFDLPDELPPLPDREKKRIRCRGDAGIEVALHEAIAQVYDIKADNQRLRQAATEPQHLPASFDHLRKTYALRNGFSHYTVVLSPISMDVATILSGFRFAVDG